MADGYDYAGEGDFSDLDEWLCEYVDGTIDPVVRKALEEYMQVNPALASHVERLRQTRNLLCCYGCRHQAPQSLQPSLQRRLASEIVQESQPVFSALSTPLVSIAALSSMVAIFLIVASASQPIVRQDVATLPFETSQRLDKGQRRSIRATPLMSLSSNKYYSHFTRPNLSTAYSYQISPTLVPEYHPDTSSARSAPAHAFISP